MSTLTHGRPALLLASAVLLAGCGDSPIEPLPDYDPTRTLQQLNAVVDPLDASENAFLGINLAALTVDSYGAASLAAAVAASAATLNATLNGAGAAASARVPGPQRFRDLAAGVMTAAAGRADGAVAKLTFPGGIRGATLEWDPADGYLVSDRPGAPANGVRLVLYEMDSATGYPSEPTTEIGYIDLTDEDRTLAERVGVRVVETGRTVSITLADYTVDMSGSGTNAEGTLELVATGEVGDAGGHVAFDLAQQYAWSQARDSDALVLAYNLQAPGSGPPVLLTVNARSPFNAAEWWTLEFLASFEPGTPQEVQLDVSIGTGDGLSGGIWTQGQEVVRVGGVDGDPQFIRGNGTALAQSEVAALRQLWLGVSDLITLGEWVMVPATLLYADG